MTSANTLRLRQLRHSAQRAEHKAMLYRHPQKQLYLRILNKIEKPIERSRHKEAGAFAKLKGFIKDQLDVKVTGG